jgi:uncharacterized protein (TIGR02996 family)
MDFKKWLLEHENHHAAFQNAVRQDPHDDTNWLAYADYLDENDHPQQAARIRWWMGARNKMRNEDGGREWDDSHPGSQAHPSYVSLHTKLNTHVKSDWIRRLFGIEHARHAHDRFGHSNEPEIKNAVDDAHHAAEKHAFGLTSDEDRNKAYEKLNKVFIDEFPDTDTGGVPNTAHVVGAEYLGPEWYSVTGAAHSLQPSTDNSQLNMLHHYASSSASHNAVGDDEERYRAGQAAHNSSVNTARKSFDTLHQHMKTNPPPE